jgi:hypothetical protein
MTKKIPVLKLALSAGLLLSMATTAFGQSNTGTIRGAVLDPSGALIPQAQVTVSNTTVLSKTIKSGPSGTFVMPHLAPGSYSISIYATGFTPALEGGIYVAGGKVTRENIKLGISVEQVIEVLADDDGARGMQNGVSNATANSRSSLTNQTNTNGR